MPALATHCAYCQRPMPTRRKVYMTRDGSWSTPAYCARPSERDLLPIDPAEIPAGEYKVFIGYAQVERHQYGQFCTYRCAVKFANAAHVAGYRMKGGKP